MSLLAIGSLILASLIWGWSFPATKGLLENINPLWLNLITFGISGFIFVIIAVIRKKSLLFRLKQGALLGILIALVETPQILGLSLTSSSNTALITGVGILLAPLFESIYRRTQPGKKYILALILGTIGLYLITGGIGTIVPGDFLVLICAIFLGIYIFTTDVFEHKKKSSLVSLCAQQFLTISVISLILIILFQIPLNLTSVQNYGKEILLITLFPTLLAYFLEDFGQEKVNTITASFLLVLEPVFGALFSVLLLVDSFSPLKLVGSVILIFSIALSILHKKKG